MALRKYGAPPQWFYTVYDAIVQNLPLGPWPSIMQQPIYWTRRFRFVHEALKQARMEQAVKAKAMGVVDLGQF